MRSSTVLAIAAIAAAPIVAAYPSPAAPSGSEALSIGKAFNIAKDGYNAYESVKGAYESWKNNHKREIDQLVAREIEEVFVREIHDALVARDVVDELARRGRLAKVHDGINIVNDAANAAQSVHGAYESWKHNHKRGRVAKIHDGINIVNDAANAAQSVHGAYESWKQSHRREPEPFYKWALHPIAARFLLEELD